MASESTDPVIKALLDIEKREQVAQKAATLALDLLRQAVSDLTSTIASNASETHASKAGSAGNSGAYNPDTGLGGHGSVGDVGKSGLNQLLTDSADKVGESLESFVGYIERGGDRLAHAIENPVYSLLKFGQRLEGVAGKAIGAGANMAGKAVTDPAVMLAGKFAAILGPMAIFGQILQSNASGFQVLSGAVKVLAGTLAPVLMPVVAVVAAGMVELSDKLWNELAPGLEDFYAEVMDSLVPAVEEFVQAIVEAAEFLALIRDPLGGDEKRVAAVEEGRAMGMTDEQITKAAREANWSEHEIAKAIRDAGKGVATGGAGGASGDGDFSGSTGAGGAFDSDTAKPGSGSGGAGKTGASAASRPGPGSPAFKSAMDDVLKELRLSMGPRASIGDLGSVGRNFQLAAINQSPFETKLLERMDKAISALERVSRGTDRRPRAAYSGDGTGWSAGAGGGIEGGGDF